MTRNVHDMSVHVSKVDNVFLNHFCLKYGIGPERKPTAPLPHHRITDCPDGYIALYTKHFEYSNLRIPFSNFFLNFLKQYKLNISQLSPMGAIKVTHFEIACRALGGEPSLPLFRQFFVLGRAGDWYTVEIRRSTVVSCVSYVPTFVPLWKVGFFWVCADVVPFKMHWRQPDEPLNVVDPHGEEFDMKLCRKLAKHPAPLQQLPEHVLILTGLSRNLRHVKDMGLMKYIEKKGLGDNILNKSQGGWDEGGPSGVQSEGQGNVDTGGGGRDVEVADEEPERMQDTHELDPLVDPAPDDGLAALENETFFEGGKRQQAEVLASSSKRRALVEVMPDVVTISSSSEKDHDVAVPSSRVGDMVSERSDKRIGKEIAFSSSDDEDAPKFNQVVRREAKKEALECDEVSWYEEKMRLQQAKNAKLKKKVRKLKKLKRSTLDKGREAIEMVAALQKELEDARAEGEEKLKAESEKLKVERETVQKLNGELEVKSGERVSLKSSLERVSSERRWLIEEGFEYVITRLHKSEEYLKPLGRMQSKLWSLGAHQGVVDGYTHCKAGVAMEKAGVYKPDAEKEFTKAANELKHTRFPYVIGLSKCTEGTLDELKALEPIGMEKEEDEDEVVAASDQTNR